MKYKLPSLKNNNNKVHKMVPLHENVFNCSPLAAKNKFPGK